MFGDCHAIVGVLIGKCVLEWANIAALDAPFGSFFSHTFTYRDIYLLFCALMSNAPDLDTIIIRLLRLNHFNHHRTWSHSFLGSIFIVPLLAFALDYYLGAFIGWYHALFIAFACFYSHLVTDWITSYGIGLFWVPGVETKFYSLGVITIFDSVTLIIWYAAFIASWYGLVSPTRLFLAFSTVLSAWLLYKRRLLYAAHRYTWTLSKGPLKDSWLQPSSFNPHLFGYFYARGDDIYQRADIRPYHLGAEAELCWTENHTNEAVFGTELGYSRVAPRQALTTGNKVGTPYRRWMVKQTRWSFVFVLAHLVWFVLAALEVV